MRILRLIFPILIIPILAIDLPDYFAPEKVISGSGQRVTLGDYTVENNDWAKGDLVIGKDYTQQISFKNGNLQHGVTMKWAYPEIPGPLFVYGYPEVIWGNKLGYLGTMKYSNQIKNITDLSVDYSVTISGETNNFSIGIEIWTSNKPWGTPGAVVINEMMVKVHGWQDGAGILYKDDTLTALQAIHRNVQGHTFITLDSVSDKLSGKISFYRIINELVNAGIINKNDYISGVELGAEIKKGYGSLAINRFQVTQTLATAPG